MRTVKPLFPLFLVILVFLVRAADAAEYYAAWRYAKLDPPYPWDQEMTTSTPTAVVGKFCDFFCGEGLCNQTAYAYFNAKSDRNRLDVRAAEYPGDGATGTCYGGGDAAAHTLFDVTIRCNPGVASPIAVSLNFEAKGSSSRTYSPPLANNAFAFLVVHACLAANGISSTWFSSLHQSASPPANTGAFSAAPSAVDLDGSFVGTTEYLALDANDEVTATFKLRALVEAASNPGTGLLAMTFHSADNAAYGVSLPRGTPVFNLPAGCTCESVDAEIVDNCIGGGCAPVAVQPTTWGKIKSLYR